MTTAVSTLRPGLLVSLKSSVRGNVKYNKTPTATTRVGDEEVATWSTERTIADPVEHEAAAKARARARSLIASVCANSAFGLLCPEQDQDKLDAAVAAARAVVDAFNATAKLSRLNVYIIAGRIAPDDVEAVKAINSEVRDLLNTMEQGVKNLDVAAIRDAASRAKSIGQMLSPDMQARIQIAVDTARNAAKAIVKAGEQAAVEVDLSAVRKIAESRSAFLDLDEAREVQAPVGEARTIDLAPEAPTVKLTAGPVRELEL
jgi:hypothetical protein